MSKFSLCLVASCACAAAVAGCATTSPALVATTTPLNGSVIPARTPAAEMPSVRAILPEQLAANPLTTDLAVCVNGDGVTESVTVRRSSGVPTFDGAVVRDVQSWRYEPNPLELSCQETTVTYER